MRVEIRRWGCGIFLASGGGGNVAPSVQRMNATLHYLTDQTGQKPPTFCRSRRVSLLARAIGGFVFLHGDDDGAEDAIVSPYAGGDLEHQVQKGGVVRITTRAGRLNIPWVVRIEVP